jgi:predicted transcriptional regulator
LGRPSGRKTDENVDQVKELVYENRRNTTHEVADMLGVSFGSVQNILKDLIAVSPQS